MKKKKADNIIKILGAVIVLFIGAQGFFLLYSDSLREEISKKQFEKLEINSNRTTLFLGGMGSMSLAQYHLTLSTQDQLRGNITNFEYNLDRFGAYMGQAKGIIDESTLTRIQSKEISDDILELQRKSDRLSFGLYLSQFLLLISNLYILWLVINSE